MQLIRELIGCWCFFMGIMMFVSIPVAASGFLQIGDKPLLGEGSPLSLEFQTAFPFGCLITAALMFIAGALLTKKD